MLQNSIKHICAFNKKTIFIQRIIYSTKELFLFSESFIYSTEGLFSFSELFTYLKNKLFSLNELFIYLMNKLFLFNKLFIYSTNYLPTISTNFNQLLLPDLQNPRITNLVLKF